MIGFTIYGEPIPCHRPRFAFRGKYPHAYDDQKKIKEQYKWQIREAYREEPMDIPLYMDITFFMPIPKGTSHKKIEAMLNGSILPEKRPDLDNCTKLILDCMNDLVYTDDARICELHCKKVYSLKPCTVVKILPALSTEILSKDRVGKEVDENDYRF